jgi:hypothetical protein
LTPRKPYWQPDRSDAPHENARSRPISAQFRICPPVARIWESVVVTGFRAQGGGGQMWITFVIFASFVVAMVAMAYFGITSHEEAPPADGGDVGMEPGRCGLCKAPLRRNATSDEVVFELEHRIDFELGEISRAWHAPSDHLGRAFPV